MKTYNYRIRNALILIVTCLFLSGYAANQAMSYDTQPRKGAALLNINRIPDLGDFVVVRLWIDGMPAASIAYGHSYAAVLPPGRHVLAVSASPNPKWWTPSQIILDARSGQTYNLIAMGDRSGSLILTPPGGFYRVRGR